MCHQQTYSKEMRGQVFQAERKTEQRGKLGTSRLKEEERKGQLSTIWVTNGLLGKANSREQQILFAF